ncbi:MAG: hypothetical protein PHW01_03305 [Patescibacteria group bacterium]|nr:hypothetical protein [Patescibacteria group bacterium]
MMLALSEAEGAYPKFTEGIMKFRNKKRGQVSKPDPKCPDPKFLLSVHLKPTFPQPVEKREKSIRDIPQSQTGSRYWQTHKQDFCLLFGR